MMVLLLLITPKPWFSPFNVTNKYVLSAVGLGVLHFNTPPYGHPGVPKHLGKRGTIPPANRDPARRLDNYSPLALAIFQGQTSLRESILHVS